MQAFSDAKIVIGKDVLSIMASDKKNIFGIGSPSSKKRIYHVLAWPIMAASCIAFIYAGIYGIDYILIPMGIAFIALLISIGGKKVGMICSAVLFFMLLGGYSAGKIVEYISDSRASLAGAILRGKPKLVERKIREGHDVNAKFTNTPVPGRTMLTCTFFFVYHHRYKYGTYWNSKRNNIKLEMMKVLLDHGADVNAIDDYHGMAPLHYAVNGGPGWPRHITSLNHDYEVVKTLIDRGADVNLKTGKARYPHFIMEEGNTPLHIATIESSIEVGDLLLINGADINAKNDQGLTPLQLALEKGYKEKADFLRAKGAK